MDAHVSLTGNLGADVDFTEGEGWCGARFRIAHTPRLLRGGEWVDGTTTWLSVRVTGRLARNCHECLRKGDPVVVAGRLRTRTWVDEERKEHEQLVVEAVAVGHDLSWGLTRFQRPQRAEAPICPEEAERPSPWCADADEVGRDLADADEVEEAVAEEPVPV